MITLKDYFMGHDKDPQYKYELDDYKYNNAVILISKINRLEEKLNQFKYEVTSGWRPKVYNKQIGGALRSNHVICRAIDIKDVDNLLGNYLKENVKVLAVNAKGKETERTRLNGKKIEKLNYKNYDILKKLVMFNNN
jgi:ribosomal protein S18